MIGLINYIFQDKRYGLRNNKKTSDFKPFSIIMVLHTFKANNFHQNYYELSLLRSLLTTVISSFSLNTYYQEKHQINSIHATYIINMIKHLTFRYRVEFNEEKKALQ